MTGKTDPDDSTADAGTPAEADPNPIDPFDPAAADQPPTIQDLVQLLSDNDYRTRENATRDLWLRGTAALDALRQAAAGTDPEAALRSRGLLRKIELHLTPDTDPEIIELVESYGKASRREKVELFSKLRQKRAFRQMLKLFSSESDVALREDLSKNLQGVAVHGARDLLLLGDAAGAREFLELDEVNEQSLIALAAFHRGQGTLEAEIEAARDSTAKGAAAWRTALYRVAGDLDAAATAAAQAGNLATAAAMQLLAGDPIPWMNQPVSNRHGEDGYKIYLDCATRRWQGKTLRPQDLEPLDRLIQSRNLSNRWTAISTLYLLGEVAAGEELFAKTAPFEAFRQFETLERIDDALKVLGIDPETLDFTEWAKQRFDTLIDDPDDSDDAHSELVTLASFLERRGRLEELAAAYDTQLDRLAEEDIEVFTSFLSSLFGTSLTGSGAPIPSKRAAIAWAGDDEDKWEEVLIAAFGESDELNEWWAWSAELKPAANRAERLDGMLALFGYGTDPKNLRRQWLRLAWKAIDATPLDQRPPLLRRVLYAATAVGDSATTLKVSQQLPGEEGAELITNDLLADNDRWQEAADRILARITAISGSANSRVRPELHAFAASSLRRAGHAEKAATHDEWVETLALGDFNTSIMIANGYRFGGDFERAATWLARAARECAPGSSEFYQALESHSEALFQQGEWLRAAATAEACAHIRSGAEHSSTLPIALLRLRLRADLPYALHLLESDRDAAIALLARCHSYFPSDGTLADDFFPSLRRVGLNEEHDQWFEESWQRLQAVIDRFPGSDNTRNTAAWLASRANRRIDEAEQQVKEALALNPDQPAYLDTLAEVKFARGDRKRAVATSRRAINFEDDSDSLPILRQQYFRFLEGPLPAP